MEDQSDPVIAARVQAQPEGVLESIASELGVSLFSVIRHLPQEQWTEMDGLHFGTILGEVATWGEVLTLVHTEDVILEMVGAFPRGKPGHGFYNLAGSGPLKGHLRADHCARIVYLRRHFMGLDTASLLFFNHQGACMFKIFARRDASRALDGAQAVKFEELARRFSGAARSLPCPSASHARLYSRSLRQRVFRPIPSARAASAWEPLQASRTARMCSRSTSRSGRKDAVDGEVDAVSNSSGRSADLISGPRASAAPCFTAFCSSRTFPGQP